jgi:hypothetical protein
VAGVQAQRWVGAGLLPGRAGQRADDLGLELGGERGQQRREPRVDAPFGPDQLLGQRAQRRSAAAAADHQGVAELALGVPDPAPGVPV